MCAADIEGLRALGVSDTEILEAVQASACFAYWVRFINALGIQLGDETIGKYASPPLQEP
jgi:alkylhydroperoxidase family enzyme